MEKQVYETENLCKTVVNQTKYVQCLPMLSLLPQIVMQSKKLSTSEPKHISVPYACMCVCMYIVASKSNGTVCMCVREAEGEKA